MNEDQRIKWEECFVCDDEDKGGLRFTTKGIVIFCRTASGFLEERLVSFDPAKIATNYVVGENGTEHHNFNHHDCHAQKISKISS